MKRLSVVLVATIIVLAVPFAAYAASSPCAPKDTAPRISQNPRYYAEYPNGTRVLAAYKTTEFGLVRLSKEEYATLLMSEANQIAKEGIRESESVRTGVVLHQPGVPVTFYDESGHANTYRSDLRSRISRYVQNNTQSPAELEISGSKTQGTVYSWSFSATEKSAVTAEIGVSVQQSYTFTETVRETILPGHKGWMEFTPYFWNTWGYMQYGVTTDTYPYYVIFSEKRADIYIPNKIGGMLDGIVHLMEAPVS